MRIDWNAAAIVGDGQESVGVQFYLDEGGMPRQRLVHRVVDDFGEQMMQRLLVGAADIHARPAADRLKAFQHLDIARGIAGLRAGIARGDLKRRRGPSARKRRTGRSADFALASLISMVSAYFLHVSARGWRGKSIILTMPWMGAKK